MPDEKDIVQSKNSSLPVVSVVIPMYNAAQYIESCLKSVLSQTITNYEIICVDDCSTDDTAKIVMNFAQKDRRIKLYRHSKNSGGASEPRNTGIKLSRGEYIAFLDADDLYTKTALAELVTIAEETHADVIHTEQIFIPKKQTIKGKAQMQLVPFSRETGKFCKEPTLETDKLAERVTMFHEGRFFGLVQNKLYRRNYLVEKNLYFDKLPIFEDLIFYFKVVCTAPRIVRVPNIFYIYRDNPNSITGKQISDTEALQMLIQVMIEGSKVLDDFTKDFDFFAKNPVLRNLPIDYIIQQNLISTQKFYNKYLDVQVESFVRKELEKYCKDSTVFFAYILSALHAYRKQIVTYLKADKMPTPKNNKELRALVKQREAELKLLREEREKDLKAAITQSVEFENLTKQNQELQAATAQKDEELKALSEQNEELKTLAAKKDEEFQSATAQKDEEIKTLFAQNEELKALAAKKDEELKAVTTNKDDELKAELEKKDAELKTLTAQNARFKAMATKRGEDFKNLLLQNAELKTTVTKRSEELQLLTEQNEELKALAAKKDAELKVVTANKDAEFRADLEKKDAELKALTTQNARLKATVTKRLEEIKLLTAQNEELKAAKSQPTKPQNIPPAVSVVISTFNSEKFIAQTLESLLYQSMNNFEVIVIDDYSTDNTVEIATKFKDKFGERLRIAKMHHHTGTPGLLRNAGIQVARGKYITFLGSEDLYTKTALEEMTRLAEEFKADVVRLQSDFILWGGEKKDVDDPATTNFAELTNPENFALRRYSEEKLTAPTLETDDIGERVRKWMGNIQPSPRLQFYRRNFIVENNLSFPATLDDKDTSFAFAALSLAKNYLNAPNAVHIVRP